MKKVTEKTRIISNKKIAADHFVMTLESPYLGRAAVPGQFVMVKAAEGTTDPLLRIPLGVHAADKKGIRLLYKVVGAGTELLSLKKKGDRISVAGPLGNGFDMTPLAGGGIDEVIIVAGGHGVAPLFGLTKAVIGKKKRVTFFTGASSGKYIICAGELKRMGAEVRVATENGTRGYKGYVTDMLEEYLGKKLRRRKIIYACGPRPMLAALAECAENFRIPAQVSLDAYVACGIGACLGCAVRTTNGYKLICKDGPVFDAREIVWTELE